MFCRKIKGKWFTARTIDAASTWMLENGFDDGKCKRRTAIPLKIKYLRPEPTKYYQDTLTLKYTGAPLFFGEILTILAIRSLPQWQFTCQCFATQDYQ